MLRLRLPLPRFVSAGEIFAGAGSLAALRALDAARTVVLVSRSLLAQEGMEKRIVAAIGTLDCRIIAAPVGEPTLDGLRSVSTEIAAFGPDWIVAIGGGSVLDAGKLLWILLEHPDADFARLARPFALSALRGKARFVAVPTTAGTGSEVSSSAILGMADGRKVAIVSHDLLPDVVVLDPNLAVGVPRNAAVAAGLDALAHALEGYVSRFENPLVDTFAEMAVRSLLTNLPVSIEEPGNLSVKLEVMQAALQAGWVQNLKVPGVGHAVAHQMARFCVPHGAACGALLPTAMRLNSVDEKVRRKYDCLAAAIGLSDHLGLIAKVEELRQRLGAAERLGKLAGGGAQIIRLSLPGVVAGALADPCARANPRLVDAALVQAVLEEAI